MRAYIPHGPLLGALMGLALAAVLIPLRKRGAGREMRRKVEAAREAILSDGRIVGPKGPYVPHRRWRRPPTPHETAPPEPKGYDAGPWP